MQIVHSSISIILSVEITHKYMLLAREQLIKYEKMYNHTALLHTQWTTDYII